MNKDKVVKFVKIVSVIIVVGLIGFGFLSARKGVDINEITDSPKTVAQNQIKDAVAARFSGSGGTLAKYSQGILDSTQPEDIDILFFEGTYCPTCKALKTNIEENSVPDGVNIYTINYEQNPDLVRQYQVRMTPTLIIVDKNGKELKRLQAVITLTNLLVQLI